jgi:hypothetical protein
VSITVANSAIVEVRVSAGLDEVEERFSGVVKSTSRDLEMVDDTTSSFTQTIGIRFNGLGIPQGATIASAYVQFHAGVPKTPGQLTLQINGEDADNADAFSETDFNVSSRPVTDATVLWSPPDWPTAGEAGPDQRTANISSIIEEIVARPNWTANNSIALIITGSEPKIERVAVTYDGDVRDGGDGSTAPLLNIVYTLDNTNTAPTVTITAPANGSSFTVGVSIGFTGTANDTEDGDLTAALSWTSSLDGSIGTGGSVTTSTLSVGTHTITAEVTDIGGLTGSDQIYTTVETTNTQPIILEVRVSASSDDAEERSSGRIKLTSSDLELVFDRTDQTVGVRFNSLHIPQGAAITNAYVQFQVDETHTVATSLTIQGEDTDNATTFLNSKHNISSRPRTTASALWNPAPWTSKGEAGPNQRTPNIASIIQEVTNRSGWSSGNSLVLIVTGTGERAAESFNGDQAGAPMLHIEYE